MRARRDAGRKRLRNGLEHNNYAQHKEMASQGSYQMRTMVQDNEQDYDIDDGVYFNISDLSDENGNRLDAISARERVCNSLTYDGRLKIVAVVKDNCVRQKYPEGYHIDVPVYRIIIDSDAQGNNNERYELASKDKWDESDARAVTRWFNNIVGRRLNSKI
ncbi:MAG: hypothetical protein U5P41_01990 [Gammaproteobacteria bacterium]|nr:hypothetical protein [Gammaproteobacteria bacterium]